MILTPLSFVKPIPGFPDYSLGTLVRGSGPTMSLRIGPHSLPVTVPWNIDPEFGYRFLDEDVQGLGHPSDWYLVCVTNLDKNTINLFAPIIVNEELALAKQVTNQVEGYSTRDPFHMEGAV